MIDFLIGECQVGGDIHHTRFFRRIRHFGQTGIDEVDVCVRCEYAGKVVGPLPELQAPLLYSVIHELQRIGRVAIDGDIDQGLAHAPETGNIVELG